MGLGRQFLFCQGYIEHGEVLEEILAEPLVDKVSEAVPGIPEEGTVTKYIK